MKRYLRDLFLVCFFVTGGCSPAAAVLGYNVPKAIVLYDGSKSMYPGYSVEHPTRKTDRPANFHQQPRFVRWLLGFMALAGERFGCETMSLDAFYSEGQSATPHVELLKTFSSTDAIQQLAQSDAATAVFNPLIHVLENDSIGLKTYLKQTLDQVSQGFEGLIFLVTDNIADTHGDKPSEQDLNELFYSIRDEARYRSVHVYSYPFTIDGKQGVLAVYAILVSPTKPDENVLANHDQIFLELANAFEGKRHLKLKDLSIRPLAGDVSYSANILGELSYFSKTDQSLQVNYVATITNLLTQHSVVSGTCEVEAGAFEPADTAAQAYGATALPEGWLPSLSMGLPVIAPGSTQSLKGSLTGGEDLTPPGMDPAAMRAWAASGEPITYKGAFRIHFTDIKIRFEPQRLEEVYGMSRALAIFNINAETETMPDQVCSSEKSITLYPPPPPGGAYLPWLLGLLGLLVAGGGAFLLSRFMRPSTYRVSVDGMVTMVELRAYGRHPVRQGASTLGVIHRGAGRDFRFEPVCGQPGLRIENTQTPGTWRVVMGGASDADKIVLVAIENLQGGKPETGGDGSGRSGAETVQARRPVRAPTAPSRRGPASRR